MPKAAELGECESILIPVIPAQAGIQFFCQWSEAKDMDAGLRRHDGLFCELR